MSLGRTIRGYAAAAAAVFSGLILGLPARGQTWDGGGADNNWNTVANWNPDGLPANNGTANIIMAGIQDPTPIVNVAQDVLSLTFDNTAGAFTIGGANTLTIRSGGITNNDTDTQTINAPLALLATQQWFESFGPLAFGGTTLNLNANTLTLQFGFPTTINNAISGSGGTIVKSGTGVLTLNGATTYTGGTAIAAGTIQLGGNNILGDSTPVSLTGGTAVLDVNGFTDTIGALSSTSASAIVQLPVTSSLTFGVATSPTYTGVITGSGSATLTKAGSGNTTFSGVHTFPGTYRINQGTITISASERLDNAADLVIDSGNLTFGAGVTETVDIVTVMNSAQLLGGSGTIIGNAYNVESGTTSLHLGGSAALIKTTVGDMTLANTNTYSGGTVINAGSLTLSFNNALLSTGAVTVNSTGTLALNSSISNTIGALSGAGNVTLANATSALTAGNLNATSTFSGVISGPGTMSKTGTGMLTLSGANTYTGQTTISAGTLAMGANNVLSDAELVIVNPSAVFDLAGFSDTIGRLSGSGGSAVTLGSGTLTVALNSVASATMFGVISGSGNFTKTGTFTQILSGANTYTGTTTVSGGTLQLATASERLADTSDLTVNGGTFDLQSFNETVDLVTLTSGSIIGSGSLTGSVYNLESGTVAVSLGGSAALNKNTAGTVTLSGIFSSTYTGATTINAGTLALGSSAALPETTSVSVLGGTLNLAGFFAGIASLGGAGSVTLGSGTLAIGFGGAGSVFNGVISGSGGLIKVGAGNLFLNGVNTYTGTMEVQGGAVRLGASNVLADASDVLVTAGTFDLQSFSDTVDIVTLASGSITGTGTLTGNAFNVQSGTISAPLGGSAALTKSTADTVTLSAANTYTGGTIVNAGALEISADAHLGASGGGVSFDGGTLRTPSSLTMNRAITLNAGGGTIETLGTTTLGGSITGTGAFTKTGLGTLILNVGSPSLAALTLAAGDLDLPVGGSLNVTGAATVGASGFFSINGGLITAGSIANSGEIELLNNAQLNGPISNSGVIAGDGRLSGALTNAIAGDVRVASGETLHFTGAGANSNAGVLEAVGGTLEFDGPLTNSASTGLIFARNASLRFDGGLTNAGSVALSFGISDLFGDITNQPAATIVVSGNSDATFVDDVVNNGTLRTSSGGASVFFGAVSGSGSFPGIGTVFLEGDLRPGASPAQISFGGDVVFGSFARLQIEIGGTAPGTQFDRVVISGDAALDGRLDVTLINGFAPSLGQSFPIMTFGTHSGTFAAASGLGLGNGLRFRVDYSATGVTLVVIHAGDFDSDGDLDLRDFAGFQDCFADAIPAAGTGACLVADFNADEFVDLTDYAVFRQFFTGP